MSERSRATGYIRTPADLDAAARALDRSLAHVLSPRRRFVLITEFYRQVQNVPPEWLQGYALFLAPMFFDLIRLPFIPSIPPRYWVAALDFLAFILKQKWSERFEQLEVVREEAARHATLSHALVSSLRELHQLLQRHQIVSTGLDEGEWARVFGSSRTAFDVFDTYVRILLQHGERCSVWMTALLDRWMAFRTRPNAVSVVMLEEDGERQQDIGRVVMMDMLPSESPRGETYVGNILGQKGSGTLSQLKQAKAHAERFVARTLDQRVPRFDITFSLHEGSAEIVGESLGLAAAAGVAVLLTQRLNGSERWTLPTTLACVGSLDSEACVEDPGWSILEQKITTAFFSPLEALLIPAFHREAALHAVQRLQRRFPNRSLLIFGVTQLSDLYAPSGVFRIEHRSRLERVREYAARHSVLMLSLTVVFLFILGGYFAHRAFIDYPNLEHSLGISVGANAIVYNPKDSLVWCLRDHDKVRSSIVDFGDIEVGDGFTRNFWLWNMTPRSLDVHLSIEGDAADSWYLNWKYGRQEVASAASMQFSVKFAPVKAGRSKMAFLVLRDPSSQRYLHRIELHGAADKPEQAGYALRMDGMHDHILFGKRSTAFDVPEGTFECWIKPYDTVRTMILHNGIARQAEPSTDDLWLGFFSPRSLYIRVGSEIGLFELDEEQALLPGKWSHLALAYSLVQRRIAVYVNGDVVEDRRTDFILEGPGSAYVTIGAQNNTRNQEAFFNGELDELRFWSVFRTASEIRRTLHKTVQGLTPGLSGYWDMDATVESTVFNANLRAHSGSLPSRTAVVRSTAPLRHPTPHARVIPGPDGGSALQLSAGRYLACARWPLARYSDASFAFWFYQSGAPAIHFSYVNGERGWIAIEDTATYTSVAKHWFSDKPSPGWHHAVCTVTKEGEMTLYINGEVFDRNRTTASGLHDWHHRFEGLQLGFRFDKQQQLSAKYYNWYHPTLNHPRAYADLHVWNRTLSHNEIRDLYAARKLARDGLVASWVLDSLPDDNLNYRDSVNGLLLHIKQVRAWE
jgi:hypothetical protein